MNEFINGSYEKKLVTIDIYKANFFALIFMFALAVLYGLPYWAIHGFNYREMFVFALAGRFSPIVASLFPGIVLLAGIVLHELIHGLVWACFAQNGFCSIRFGIVLKMLTPYCHCKEPLKIRHYRLGALMPAVVLGIVPALLGLITGKPDLLILGWFFTGAAAGDCMVLYVLRKEKPENLALDHPSEAGCYVYSTRSEAGQEL